MGVDAQLRARLAQVPPRTLSGSWWHQGPPRYPVMSAPERMDSPGRYHRTGDPGTWYASDQEQAAWAELLRHWTDEGVSPFEVRRRVGRVDLAGLAVLDLTDPQVRAALGVTEAELRADDHARCRELAAAARADGRFDGIVAPSAALQGRRTLAVFDPALARLHADRDRVRRLPRRLADRRHAVRFLPDVPRLVIDELRRRARGGHGS